VGPVKNGSQHVKFICKNTFLLAVDHFHRSNQKVPLFCYMKATSLMQNKQCKNSIDTPPPSCLRHCRSFAKPPKQVQVVCECILVIRGYKEISWKSAKGMMSEGNFLRSLMEMDCDSIIASQVKTVKGKPTSILLIFLMLFFDPSSLKQLMKYLATKRKSTHRNSDASTLSYCIPSLPKEPQHQFGGDASHQ